MERLSLLRNQLTAKKKYVDSSIDYFNFDSLLSPADAKLRREVREFATKEIIPKVGDSIEKAAFPEFLLKPLAESLILKKFIKKPHGDALGSHALAMTIMELARADLSCATFFMVQIGLLMYTIDLLGSPEQKAKYLPKLARLELVGGWGLTEPDVGSDASSLTSTVTKVEGGYRLNGAKRWIGNGNRDIMVVWARNTATKQVEGFIMDIKSPGVTTKAIDHKLALRPVQNCHLVFENVFIPAENKLPGANDFNDTNKVLRHSRGFVAWAATGVAIGTYDAVIKYMSERKQFGVPITAFQLSQEKLARMMGHIQSMILMSWRITELYEQGPATIGQISLVKAWVTKTGREVVALGREMLGGNGIVADNYAMKAFTDMEAAFTYEGTYDINCLVAGRELTGIAAFKASAGPKPSK